ncbi:uncharacterized protein [Lolium perenne]|uniref:uncharacterized protein n=1 Tax=Lolium perenne TaxID=4522 RepID=UPI003A98E13B
MRSVGAHQNADSGKERITVPASNLRFSTQDRVLDRNQLSSVVSTLQVVLKGSIDTLTAEPGVSGEDTGDRGDAFVSPASLLPETSFPCDIYNFCSTVIPEASIDALKEQLATAQREKDELSRQHQEELNALKTSYQELKSQLIQLGLDHAKALKAAEVTAAAKLDEALENACNATVVLRAELEEMTKARKGAEEKAARLEEGHKECDQLILQTDTLALRLFPDSQRYAVKKVDAQRKDKGQADLTVPWTPKDHLVALNARVSHMRCIDRNLSDIPDVATQLYRTLWPGEEVPDTFSLINDRTKGAGGEDP